MEIFILSQVMFFFFCLLNFNYFRNEKIIINDSKYSVIESHQNYSILEQNKIKYLYYESLEEGNIIIIEGIIKNINTDNNFYQYLKTQKVNYIIEGNVVSNNGYLNLNNTIINKLLENKDEENKRYLRLILFNKNDINDDFYNLFSEFSITFLLVVSGFHINLIFKVLKKKKYFKYIFALFYLFLLNFQVSSFKAFLYSIIKKFNKRLNLSLNNSDILGIIMICFLFINPSYCFNKGFIYSFGFSFILDFLNNAFLSKGIGVVLFKKVLIYMFSVPIILLDNYQVNSNSLLINLIMVYPISFLFIFSFIYLIFDKFYLVYKLYIKLVIAMLEFFKCNSFNLIFGKPTYILVILLFLSLILILWLSENKFYKLIPASIVLYLLLLVYQYYKPIISNQEEVYFLDVAQGDCSIIKIKNSKKVVMIDTGGNKNKDQANDVIIPFLKSKGINCIDAIIITHDDYDHNGNKEQLLKNFRVDRIIENSIDDVYIGKNRFVNLNRSDNRENDDSIVLYGKIDEINYLFTGDISKDIEHKIIEKNNLEVDVLKVSHHGSSSSTSEEFLKSIKPNIALIGVGRNNRYNHPSDEVINRLNKYGAKIYRTDYHGNVIIYKSLISNKIIIETE